MKFLTNLTLGKKITLLTTMGLLVGVIVFSSLGMRAVNRATETMLEDRLTTAGLVADYVDEALERALSELTNTAQMIDIDDTKDSYQVHIETLETTYSRLSIPIHSIYLIDKEGEIRWSKPDIAWTDGDDSFHLSSFIQTINLKEASVSGLTIAPALNVPVVFLGSPTGIGKQGDSGILLVAIEPAKSSIGGFVYPVRLGETGYIEIIDQNGIVVVRTEPGPELSPFEKSDHSGRFADLIRAGNPTQGVCHTCHEAEQRVDRKDVLAFVPLSRANWGVVIRQSEDEALAPTRELRQNLILFGIVLVTVALLFVVVTTRDVGSRIRVLTVASKKIAEGDLDSQVANLGRDEVGVLSQALDDMRRKLKTSYGELKQKTQELSSLLSVSEILYSAIDLSPVLDAVVVKAVEVVPNADGGLLFLCSGEHDALVLRCIIGMNKDAFPDIITAPGSAPDSEFVSKSEGEATKKTSAVEEAIDTFLRSELFQSKVQSFICGKVFERNRVIGGLVLVNFSDKDVFSESDYRLLQAIADGIGITIERAHLANEAEEARALHEADRLRSQFISSVSHELRTPLTLIKGYSTSLLRKDASWRKETQREFLQVIDEKTDELRDLIDKILQSAKLEAGAVKLEKEPLLIPRLVEKVVEEISPRTKKHKFDLSFAPNFPVVEADVRCIEQVLRNLLENAVKYSPNGGVAKISGKVIRDRIIVEIKDNGTGISPEYHDKIFERFYRVDSNLTRGTTGSGLGLSIVKAHVEAHDGEVWFKSAAGKGSAFYFSLPLSEGYEED